MRFLSIATFLSPMLMVSGCAGHFYRLQPDTVCPLFKSAFCPDSPKSQHHPVITSPDQSAVRGSRGLWTVFNAQGYVFPILLSR